MVNSNCRRTPFVLAGSWSRFGQWGHLEFTSQDPDTSPRYAALREWLTDQNSLRHPDDPAGAVPHFDTAPELPLALRGTPYSRPVEFSGGDGALTLVPLLSQLPPGLAFDPATRLLSGTPLATGEGRLLLRIQDAEGDPAWRIFTVQVVAPGSVIALEPVADAGVVQFDNLSDTNLGNDGRMAVVSPLIDIFQNNPSVSDGAKAYLKFDLSPLYAAGIHFRQAELRLRRANPGDSSSNPAIILYQTSNDWLESTITFNNRPLATLGSPIVTGQVPPGILPALGFNGGEPQPADLTSHLQSQTSAATPVFSLIVASTGYQDSVIVPALASRENEDPARHPQLLLTIGGPPHDTDADGLPDTWETLHFNSLTAQDATGDPDQDGIENLLEYAFNLSPLQSTTAQLPAPVLEAGRYTWNLTPQPHLTYQVQSSPDLTHWSASGLTVLTDTPSLLKVQQTSSGTSPLFFRILITSDS